jgi:uncharacterized protein
VAYTPVARRKLGYYALPVLFGDRAVGWSTLEVRNGRLKPRFGYAAAARPRDRGFARGLEAELQRMHEFLGLP